jgi:hypothetical protein
MGKRAMGRLMVGCLALGLSLASPAITVCYDYVIWKITCQDTNRNGPEQVREAMRQKRSGYHLLATITSAHLIQGGYATQPGDVFIFGGGHVAIVGRDGHTMKHFLQTAGKSGQPHEPKDVKPLSWSLQQIIDFKRISPEGNEIQPYLHNWVEIWRSDGGLRRCNEEGGAQSQTLTVTNMKAAKVRTSFDTVPGALYMIEASGVISDWGDKGDGVDPVWCYAPWRCGTGEPWQQLRINDRGMADIAGRTIPYNAGHVYRIQYTGDGRPIEFYCIDAQGSWQDNKGVFTVQVARVQ